MGISSTGTGSAPKVVVVGDPIHNLTQWGTVTITPPVYLEGERWVGIKAAMRNAVEVARLGDVICQNDIRFTADPFARAAVYGKVRTLSRPKSHRHCCPRAFIIYDEQTRERVLDSWSPEGKRMACIAWKDVEKVSDWIVAVHERRGQNGNNQHPS